MVKELKEFICLRCGFEWQPRVINPKSCPGCKSYIWNSEEKKDAKL